MDIAPLLVSTRDAARMLAVSERTLFTLRKAGLIRPVSVGLQGVRYSVEELQRFIRESEAKENSRSNGRDGSGVNAKE